MGWGVGSRINYIRKEEGIGERIPYDNPLLWPFHRSGPHLGLFGLDPKNNSDIIAGYFGHFINVQFTDFSNSLGASAATSCGVVGTLTKLKYGKGRILVSTFKADPNSSDPVAKILLEDIIQYALNGFDAKTELR